MSRLKEHGFTLVEVLVISPILILTAATMANFLFDQYGQLVKQSGIVSLQIEAQNIAFSMQDDLFYADRYLSNEASYLDDPHEPSAGWSYDSTPPTLIISNPAATKNRRAEDREPVYINQNGCSPQSVKESNDLFFNNIIYFVSESEPNKLYKRNLDNPSSINLCDPSYLVQTCPEASASPSCPKDVLLTDKLDTFEVTYYDTSNAEVIVPENGGRVEVTIGLKGKAYAVDIEASASINVRKINI